MTHDVNVGASCYFGDESVLLMLLTPLLILSLHVNQKEERTDLFPTSSFHVSKIDLLEQNQIIIKCRTILGSNQLLLFECETSP